MLIIFSLSVEGLLSRLCFIHHLLISPQKDVFFTDFRYRDQSEREVSGFDIVIMKRDPLGFIRQYMKKSGITRCAIEDTVSYRTFSSLSRSLTLIPLRNTVENLRIIKSRIELTHIELAIQRAEDAFKEIKGHIRTGNSEMFIASRLEECLKRKGVEKIPFDTIVASGRNSALPHARPSEKKLEPGDLVIIDWGGESKGYFSDMTRTYLLKGGDSGRKRKIHELVLKANSKARKEIRTGISCSDVDNAARSTIKAAGYGEYFGHATGHGIGLDVHEQPSVSEKETKTVLQSHMVFTVEPGIYIPNLGGVRIEDMVVVLKNEGKTLTSLPRKLEIV